MCLTLANAAVVLDHVNSVRPARSYTRTLHHAGHLSPGDLWRALDGEYPRTAIHVRRHHDVITLTDQYGDTFAYPTGAAIPTAVPDALESANGGRLTSPPGSRTCRPVLPVRDDDRRPPLISAAIRATQFPILRAGLPHFHRFHTRRRPRPHARVHHRFPAIPIWPEEDS